MTDILVSRLQPASEPVGIRPVAAISEVASENAEVKTGEQDDSQRQSAQQQQQRAPAPISTLEVEGFSFRLRFDTESSQVIIDIVSGGDVVSRIPSETISEFLVSQRSDLAQELQPIKSQFINKTI